MRVALALGEERAFVCAAGAGAGSQRVSGRPPAGVGLALLSRGLKEPWPPLSCCSLRDSRPGPGAQSGQSRAGRAIAAPV